MTPTTDFSRLPIPSPAEATRTRTAQDQHSRNLPQFVLVSTVGRMSPFSKMLPPTGRIDWTVSGFGRLRCANQPWRWRARPVLAKNGRLRGNGGIIVRHSKVEDWLARTFPANKRPARLESSRKWSACHRIRCRETEAQPPPFDVSSSRAVFSGATFLQGQCRRRSD